MHANRLGPRKELDNDYILLSRPPDVELLETEKRKTKIRIPVGNTVDTKCDVIVNTANELLLNTGGAVRALAEAACERMTEATMTTTAGKLQPVVKVIVHTVGPDARSAPYKDNPTLAQEDVRKTFYKALLAPDDLQGIESLACTAISGGIFGIDIWTVATWQRKRH